jgi:U4/U6.U5 tri-snRNP component SNU23
VARANLQARDFEIDLASKLNKSQVQSVAMPLSAQAGYFCNVCDCVLKDSLAYLDHINGKWHNRALGMSMRVEQSTVEQVRGRLDELKRRKKEGAGEADAADHVPDGLTREGLEREEASGRQLGSAGDATEQEAEEGDEEEEEDGVDPEFAAMMGFGGFGGSKKG